MMVERLPVEDDPFDPDASYEQTDYPPLIEERTGPQKHIIAISEPFAGWPPEQASVWRRGDRHIACWRRYSDIDGFVDFSHVFRPIGLENTVQWPAIGFAQTWLTVHEDTQAEIQLGWVSDIKLQINDGPWQTFDQKVIFDSISHDVSLRAGSNRVRIKLHNPEDAQRQGRSFGTWLFAFRALHPNGQEIRPQLSEE
jgi:hypothetical protein